MKSNKKRNRKEEVKEKESVKEKKDEQTMVYLKSIKMFWNLKLALGCNFKIQKYNVLQSLRIKLN